MANSNDISIFSVIKYLSEPNTNSSNIKIQLGKRALASISDFHKIITGLQNELMAEDISLSKLIAMVMTNTNLTNLIDSEEKAEERFENIEEYKSSSKPYEDMQIHEALANFLESISLVSDVDSYETDSDLITLITLHQAKGLEFSTVFIAGLEEWLLPHIRSIETGDPAELEEERRLCYVGITRAKTQLYISKTSRRGFRGATEPSLPSRFLHEIPNDLIKPINDIKITSNNLTSKKYITPRTINKINPNKEPQIEFKDGDKVKHPKFGNGIIISSEISGNDYKLTITFKDGVGIKKLMAGMSNLTKI